MSFRFIIASFLFFGLLVTVPSESQDKAQTTNTSQKDLELTTVGEAKLSTGRRGALRIYTAPDGTKGTMTYGQFKTVTDAQRQIQEWTKLLQKTVKNDQKKDKTGRVIEQRLEGITRSTRSGLREFVVIKRDSVNCYLIESPSQLVALQIEELTN